jgi:hypothetical protein
LAHVGHPSPLLRPATGASHSWPALPPHLLHAEGLNVHRGDAAVHRWMPLRHKIRVSVGE